MFEDDYEKKAKPEELFDQRSSGVEMFCFFPDCFALLQPQKNQMSWIPCASKLKAATDKFMMGHSSRSYNTTALILNWENAVEGDTEAASPVSRICFRKTKSSANVV